MSVLIAAHFWTLCQLIISTGKTHIPALTYLGSTTVSVLNAFVLWQLYGIFHNFLFSSLYVDCLVAILMCLVASKQPANGLSDCEEFALLSNFESVAFCYLLTATCLQKPIWSTQSIFVGSLIYIIIIIPLRTIANFCVPELKIYTAFSAIFCLIFKWVKLQFLKLVKRRHSEVFFASP